MKRNQETPRGNAGGVGSVGGGGTEVLERDEVRQQQHREPTRTGPVYRPSIDIYETGDELVVLADMPGVSGEDVDIRFENGLLTIHGRVRPRQDERTLFMTREYGIGDYARTFQVNEDVDVAGISAEMSGGVLTVHLPRSEAAKPRRIKVQSRE